MSTAKAFNSKAAVSLESTYGALMTTGFEYLPFVSSSGDDKYEMIARSAKSASGPASLVPIRGDRNVTKNTLMNLDYLLMNNIFKVATGSDATGTPPVYNYNPADEIGAYSLSLVEDLQASYPSYAGGLIEQLVIKSSAGQQATVELQWIFQSRTLGAFPTIVTALTETPVLHSHLVFRIGNILDALAAGDALKVRDITLTMKNNMIVEFASESSLIVKPIREKERETTLDITGLYYDSSDEITAIVTAAENHTQLQADLTWSNTGAGGEKIEIQLPELFMPEKPQLGIPVSGLHPFAAKFTAYKNVHNTTNMAAATKEVLYKITETAA